MANNDDEIELRLTVKGLIYVHRMYQNGLSPEEQAFCQKQNINTDPTRSRQRLVDALRIIGPVIYEGELVAVVCDDLYSRPALKDEIENYPDSGLVTAPARHPTTPPIRPPMD
jgi:hypothetical protein